ncbi:MAG: AAA family ATPase [Acidobacteria bacterium]|nr:AAA family ATPase [Acidobacteriota bacterium]
MNSGPFLRRVILKNYKSIAVCNLNLGPLTILVGPNGSGKSNFLDALRLVSEALRTTLDHALRDRGGINEVRRRSSGHPTHFGMRLEFVLANGAAGHYAFRVGAKPRGAFEVQTEECVLHGAPGASFRVDRGTRKNRGSGKTVGGLPSDRLHLVAASGEIEFRPVYDALAHMAFYNLNPDKMRELQTPDAGDVLFRDGGNATSVLRLLSDLDPDQKKRLEDYLAQVVPGVVGVEASHVGPKETLKFRQSVAGSHNPWQFMAGNMSDGTLRALGILLSLFQKGQRPVTLVGIEEPETALHPAAAGVLLDALREVSAETQVIVTSHSPDLLDLVELDREEILAVRAAEGNTEIGPIDQASMKVLKDRLYTPGELLRLNQFAPEAKLFGDTAVQGRLFDEGVA